MNDFLLAVPVFNEEDHLLPVLAEVRRYASHVLVVDDGSTDATPALLRGRPGVRVIRHAENRGYGQALISAFDYAISRGFDWLITMDCDLQHEPAAIPRFVQETELGGVDILSGSRYLVDQPGASPVPADRRRINLIITRLLNELLSLRLTDAFCGFKAYRVAALARLRLDIPGYAMPLQLWVQAVRLGLRVKEIPVRLIYNDPDRHFGGHLDDPDSRLAHYLAVISRELARTGLIEGSLPIDWQEA